MGGGGRAGDKGYRGINGSGNNTIKISAVLVLGMLDLKGMWRV